MASLTEERLGGRRIVQVAFVVDDLTTAAMQWSKMFGAGPFFVHETVPVSEVHAGDGSSGVFEFGAAFGQWGSVMVELIKIDRVEPDSAASLMWRPGFNHVAYFASDPDAERARLERSGAPVLLKVSIGGVPLHFHNALATTGCIIEHYPFIEAYEYIYRQVQSAADRWDGTDPVRGPLGM